MPRQPSYRYAIGHDRDHEYELQEFVMGRWHRVRDCTKAGGANAARACAKRDGHPYRVLNKTTNKVYVECR